MCQFKAKHSEIKPYILCLGNISKRLAINNMRKTVLKGVEKVFSVDYKAIDPNNISDIYCYFIKET